MLRARPLRPPGVRAWLASLALAGLLVSCTRDARVRPVVGPDGTPMLHVSCGGDQGSCFELAGRSCPQGYTLIPLFDRRDNNFLARCRSGAEAALVWNPPLPPTEPSVFSLGGPSAPAPVSNTARSATVTNPADPNEIDLGY